MRGLQNDSKFFMGTLKLFFILKTMEKSRFYDVLTIMFQDNDILEPSTIQCQNSIKKDKIFLNNRKFFYCLDLRRHFEERSAGGRKFSLDGIFMMYDIDDITIKIREKIPEVP
jgi:hypothetical protein